MDLLQQMVTKMLSRGELSIALNADTVQFLENQCALILQQIRQIVSDDTIDDPECFQRIESIVCLLEENGIDCGPRHDFG